MHKRGALSFLQIVILVVNIISISYIVGSEVKSVSAINEETLTAARKDYSSLTPKEKARYDEILKGISSSGTPTHGYAGVAWEHFFGPGTTQTGWGYSASGILQGAYRAVLVYGIVQLIGGFLGLDSNVVSAASTAASWGYFVGKGAYTLFGPNGIWNLGLSTGWALGIGIAVAIIIYVLSYSKIKKKIITYDCNPWDAATGGSSCEKCNEQSLPCSEYQCRSLGQACELINPGTTQEKCIWVNPKDVGPPIIGPNSDVLFDGYKYTPDNAISPPDRGVKIINQNSDEGCAKAFTPFTFGITVDEPAKCKIDYLRKDSFDEMEYYFGDDSLLKYNHTQAMSLPGPDNLEDENITLNNNGQFELYTRCQDANGNVNIANFVFKFCVEEGPDTTPPLIVGTSLINGMPISYNQSSVDLEVYINEPAECKWSHLDQGYDDMENEMSCSSSVQEMNSQSLYPCSTTLTGLKNNFENEFYFRCKDQPLETSDRNVNTESYKFILLGTQPLVIDEVEPDNETIKDSSEAVKVTLRAKTSAGYKEGESTCFYSSDDEENYVMFYNTISYEHSQELWLSAGDYKYFIKCIDLGGNSETKEINFIVESDNDAPLIVRAYHDEPYLKIITNEEAECVYDTTDCGYLFDDGTTMATSEGLEHFTDWNTKTNLYIKCKDNYGNSPQPSNVCSIEVRAF
ncbi:MAG: hypothetical protein PVJ67_01385 [Candidatus Pacearchaeota archaeon]